MDLTLSGEQRLLRSTLREHLAGAWPPDRLRAFADMPVLDTADWRELAHLGVFGLDVSEAPEEPGPGMAEAVIVFEELGRALVPGPLVATCLAARTMPEARDGGAVVTELDLSATPVVEHWAAATHLVMVGDAELRWTGTDRVEAAALKPPLDPMTPVARLATPPPGAAMGDAGDARRWRRYGAVLTAALQVGIAQGALDLAVRHAKDRTQFGRPIGGFQAIKHLLAESLVRTDLARASVITAGLTLEDPDAGGVDEAVAAARLLADDAATANGRTCVQVHGGMGFTWEVLAHLYLKRAWLHEARYGRAGENAEILAASL